jgi:hypothetical protein
VSPAAAGPGPDAAPPGDAGADADAAGPIDTDGDGVPDDQDVCPGYDDALDADGDGVPDGCDACPEDDPDDTDGDGVCDSKDECPGGDDHVDSDGDGVAEACDPCPGDDPDDSDGDGVCDGVDQCPGFDDAADTDGDGVADGCDPCPADRPDDTDGDTVCDSADVCPGGDDTVDQNGDGVPDACELSPGTYDYQRLQIGGLGKLVAVAFHPTGDYFVYAESYDRVHVHDVASGTDVVVDVHTGTGHFYLEHVVFAPSGEYALILGYDTQTSRGVIVRFDHAAWVASQPDTTGVFSAYANLPQAGAFASAAFSGPGANPVVLARSGTSPYTMFLGELDDAAGTLTILPSSASATSAGCQDVVYADNEWLEPGLLVTCGINGYDGLYWTEVGGVPELRLDLGDNNLGNTAHAAAHPSGDYALAISWSGDAIRRFSTGLMSSTAVADFTTRRLWNVGFSPDGQRALIVGQKMTIGGVSFGVVMEYRHGHDACPQPLTVSCDVTEVSIPGFGAAPWNAPDGTVLADVAWRPGCDGGVIVGGYSSYSTTYGFVATFQRVGGVACW